MLPSFLRHDLFAGLFYVLEHIDHEQRTEPETFAEGILDNKHINIKSSAS